MYFSKQEISEFPFEKLFNVVRNSGRNITEKLTTEALENHKRYVAQSILIEYSNREDSYEGNEEEDYPFKGIDPILVKKETLLAKTAAARAFLELYSIAEYSEWFIPQMLSRISTIPLVRLEDGKYDPRSLFAEFGKDPVLRGIYILCMHQTRGDFVNLQYKSPFCALVPLILNAFKKYQQIPYSAWSTDGLDLIVDPHMYDAMTFDPSMYLEGLDKNDLLKIRDLSMLYKTGKLTGTMRNPVSTHKLYGTPSPFNKFPWLVQVMIFQIWCAHPSNRNENMVLDPMNWDTMPEPLVDVSMIKKVDPVARIQPNRWVAPTEASWDA